MRSVKGEMGDGVKATVRRGLDSLRLVPAPDPETWVRGREAFLMEVDRLVEEETGEHLQSFGARAPTVSGEHAEAALTERLKGWFPVSRWNLTPLRALIAVLVVLQLLFGGTVAAAWVIHESLPGTSLYPVKIRLEDLTLNRRRGPETTVLRAMIIASERVEETQRLGARGDAVPIEVAERYGEHLRLALENLNAVPGLRGAEVQAQLEAEIAQHHEILSEVHTQLQKAGADATSLRAVVQMLEESGLLDEGDGKLEIALPLNAMQETLEVPVQTPRPDEPSPPAGGRYEFEIRPTEVAPGTQDEIIAPDANDPSPIPATPTTPSEVGTVAPEPPDPFTRPNVGDATPDMPKPPNPADSGAGAPDVPDPSTPLGEHNRRSPDLRERPQEGNTNSRRPSPP